MTAAPSRRVAIAGAGIAGLTAALCFARRGFAVSVLERARRLEEVGAGIQLSPNATRILDRLGILGRIRQTAVSPASIDLRRACSGRVLTSIPMGDDAARRWGAPYLTVHRADIHAALAEAVAAHPAITLETGATASRVEFDDGVTLFVDKAGSTREIRCDLAIGADGVRSALRTTSRLKRRDRFTGYVAWRATAGPEQCAEIIPVDRVSAFLHRHFHLVTYPLRRGEIVNLVAITRMPVPEDAGAGAPRGMLPPGIIDDEIDALASDIDTWLPWPINEVDAAAPWVDPAGLALVGDAAHAMGPYAAQGAVMAIEDAAALAAAVAAQPQNLPAALARYEAVRQARVGQVAKRGTFNRFVWHASGPVALARDVVLAMRPAEGLAADLDWLYGYDAERAVS